MKNKIRFALLLALGLRTPITYAAEAVDIFRRFEKDKDQHVQHGNFYRYQIFAESNAGP